MLADARLQQRIDDTGRATLTSVAGLGTELGTLATYGLYAAAATVTGHGTAFAWSAVPYLLTALALAAAARTAAPALGRAGEAAGGGPDLPGRRRERPRPPAPSGRYPGRCAGRATNRRRRPAERNDPLTGAQRLLLVRPRPPTVPSIWPRHPAHR